MVDRLPIVALVVFGAAPGVPAHPFDEPRAVPGRVEAQEPQRGGAPGGPGGGPGAGFAIFAALDGDHDNTLSASEIAGAASALKALDKNGDGKVTADEFPAGRGGPGGRGGRGRGGS